MYLVGETLKGSSLIDFHNHTPFFRGMIVHCAEQCCHLGTLWWVIQSCNCTVLPSLLLCSMVTVSLSTPEIICIHILLCKGVTEALLQAAKTGGFYQVMCLMNREADVQAADKVMLISWASLPNAFVHMLFWWYIKITLTLAAFSPAAYDNAVAYTLSPLLVMH